MPNWCSNKLCISGPKEELAKFAGTFTNESGEPEFKLNQTVPMPQILRDVCTGSCMIDGVRHNTWKEIEVDGKRVQIAFTQEEKDEFKKIGYPSWYEWAIANWGTKWDVQEANTLISDEYIIVHFDTAWSPPVNWLETVSTMYPLLKFEIFCSEGGACFYGTITAQNGEVSEDMHKDFWKESDDSEETDEETDDEDDDGEDELFANTTENCRAFLSEHGLHTGG